MDPCEIIQIKKGFDIHLKKDYKLSNDSPASFLSQQSNTITYAIMKVSGNYEGTVNYRISMAYDLQRNLSHWSICLGDLRQTWFVSTVFCIPMQQSYMEFCLNNLPYLIGLNVFRPILIGIKCTWYNAWPTVEHQIIYENLSYDSRRNGLIVLESILIEYCIHFVF